MAYNSKYPYIFVHGMMGWGEENKLYNVFPYWGMVTGNQVKALRAEGIEAYAPQVSPIGSAWDRACELYAQIKGGVVDYGVAHSSAKGHARFGMDMGAGLVPNWDNVHKVHLLGHSFGGATMRMLVELLTNGSEAERKATPVGELSPLFEGGHGDWVKSLTAISAPHDGTSFVNAFPKLMIGVTYGVLGLASILGNVGTRTIYDWKMSQWGLAEIPNAPTDKKNILNIKTIRKIAKSKDNVFDDLEIGQAMDMNRTIHTSPDVYYFSVSGDGTKPVGDGTYVRAPIMIFAFIPFAKVMGRFPIGQNINGAEITEDWRRNDGLVSLESGRYPHLEPHCQFEEVKNAPIKKGIWHVLPDAIGDHGTVVGGSLSFIGFGKSAPYKNTYKYWLNFLENLPD